jgi:hypothetical protein
MSLVATGSPARIPTFQDRDAAGQAGRDRRTEPSWISRLAEALAYAGASIDPTAALPARRFARLRDQERRQDA